MTNKEALATVLALANEQASHDPSVDPLEIEALDQMEDYYNDVMED